MRTRGAGQRADAAQFGVYAGYVQADANSPEDLNLYASWLSWLFLLNDQHGEGVYATPHAWRTAVEHLRHVFESGRVEVAASTPAARALSDVLQPVYARMPASWRSRFAAHCWQTFLAVEPESAHRQQRHVPGVEEYIENRRSVSAGLPLLDLCEFMAGAELHESVQGHPLYRELMWAATEVMAWSNDISSVEKEAAAGELHNFVLVLEHTLGLSRAAAIAQVTERVEGRIADFGTAERALRAELRSRELPFAASETVQYCLRSMRHWMIGTFAWAQENPRYTEVAGRGAGAFPDHVDDLLRDDLPNDAAHSSP